MIVIITIHKSFAYVKMSCTRVAHLTLQQFTTKRRTATKIIKTDYIFYIPFYTILLKKTFLGNGIDIAWNNRILFWGNKFFFAENLKTWPGIENRKKIGKIEIINYINLCLKNGSTAHNFKNKFGEHSELSSYILFLSMY